MTRVLYVPPVFLNYLLLPNLNDMQNTKILSLQNGYIILVPFQSYKTFYKTCLSQTFHTVALESKKFVPVIHLIILDS